MLRGSGSNSLTFRDSGRARHVDKNGCGRSEIVASGVGALRGHDSAPSAAPPYTVGPTGRPPQRLNPVNTTYRPNQRASQLVAPTASVQHFSVDPALAGWSGDSWHGLREVWIG